MVLWDLAVVRLPDLGVRAGRQGPASQAPLRSLALVITILVWRTISVYQSMWPAPGLYFIEVVAVMCGFGRPVVERRRSGQGRGLGFSRDRAGLFAVGRFIGRRLLPSGCAVVDIGRPGGGYQGQAVPCSGTWDCSSPPDYCRRRLFWQWLPWCTEVSAFFPSEGFFYLRKVS